MEFGSGILDAEAPVDVGLSLVSPQFQGVDLPAEGFLVRETLPEATAGEDAELNLRHIQPVAMLGSVVKLQPPGNAPRLSRRKVWYSDALRWVFKLSRITRITGIRGYASSTSQRI